MDPDLIYERCAETGYPRMVSQWTRDALYDDAIRERDSEIDMLRKRVHKLEVQIEYALAILGG